MPPDWLLTNGEFGGEECPPYTVVMMYKKYVKEDVPEVPA
jgi:hypothetical protein